MSAIDSVNVQCTTSPVCLISARPPRTAIDLRHQSRLDCWLQAARCSGDSHRTLGAGGVVPESVAERGTRGDPEFREDLVEVRADRSM